MRVRQKKARFVSFRRKTHLRFSGNEKLAGTFSGNFLPIAETSRKTVDRSTHARRTSGATTDDESSKAANMFNRFNGAGFVKYPRERIGWGCVRAWIYELLRSTNKG